MGVYYIFQRELRSYFQSFIAYVLTAVFLLLAGYFFYSDLIMYVLFSFCDTRFAKIWTIYFNDVRYLLMLTIPLLTMRVFAEEGLTIEPCFAFSKLYSSFLINLPLFFGCRSGRNYSDIILSKGINNYNNPA